MKKHTFFIKMLSVLLALLLTVFVVPATVYADVIDMVTEAISSTSSDAPMPETSPSDVDSLLTRVGDDVFEDVDLREENVKHFRLADGSYSAYLYDMPVHILDENGKWQDIDNTLEDQNQDFATPDARIKFAKKITGNQTIFTLHEGNHKLTLSLDGAIKKTTGTAINTVTEFDESATLLQKLTTLDRLTSRIVYENILDGVDIEYIIESRNIKENIIVKESKENYTYTFTLALNNLSATLTNDGSVILSDSKSNDAIYTIPAPTATDSDGNHAPSGKVYYSLTDMGNHKYSLTVTADAEWMNHADRTFPITIDPPIRVAGESNVIDTNISTAKPNVTDAAGDAHNWVNSEYQTYWKAITLPDLPSGAHLVNATYTASFWYPSSTSGKIGAYAVITDWDSTLNWTKAHTATSPQGDVGNRCYDYVDISYTYNENDKYESFSLDLTALVKAWYEDDLPNYGICLKVLENTTYTGTAQIVSNDFVFEKNEQSDNSDENDQSDNSDENDQSDNSDEENNPDKSAHKPLLVISYRFIDGIESHWSTFSQNAGNAGTGNVNLCLGYLNHTFYGPTTTDGLLPYTFTLNYNSNYTYSSDLETSDTNLVGYVWTADFEQRIIPQSETQVTAGTIPKHYIWKDPDGTEHVFFYGGLTASGGYIDEDGLGLRLDVYPDENTDETTGENTEEDVDPNEAKYIMTTLYDETYYFNTAGYLIRYEDAWGNARIFHRTSPTIVDYIALLPSGADNEIGQIELDYTANNKLSSITYAGSETQLRFYYSHTYSPSNDADDSHGFLYKIEYRTSDTSLYTVIFEYQYTFAASYKLSKAYDEYSHTGIQYTWNGYKVSSLLEYTKDGFTISPGAQTEILYRPNGENKTVCRTRGSDDMLYGYGDESDDLLTHYYFDDYGRTTATYVTDASEEIIYGTSRTQYTETSQENPQSNNRVSHQAVSGQIPINLVKNGSFLSSVSNWTSSNADVSLYSDDSYEKALSFKPSASGTASVYQEVALQPGEYTFSANLRLSSVSGQGKARLTVTNTTNGESVASNYLNAPAAVTNVGDYVTMSVTFTVSSQTTYRVGMELTTTKISDTLYVDDVALGKSSTPSAVSILSDGSFDATSGVWYGQNITPLFNNYQFDDDTRSLGINNTSATDAYVYQTLTLLTNEERNAYVSNSASYSGAAQAYLLSGYAKADSPSPKSERLFALRAQVTYLKPNGNLYTDEWIDIPFDPYCTEWQFTSGSFTTDPQKGCPYQIKIACSYKNNVGFAYFDNIVLTKSFDSVDYAYNSQGSVTKSVNNSSGTSVEYHYTGNGVDLATEIHSNGNTIERTYQNHKVVSETMYGSGDSHPYTYNIYNNYGQLESTLSILGDAYAEIYYEYSTENASWGKLDTEITPLGETVYIYSDSPFDYGLLLAVLDENGTGSFYTYDALGRQIQVEPFVNYNFVSNGESVTNEYSGSELVSIETASTTYNFAYNDFGVNTDISVGTNKIARYLYNPYNGKLRYVVYANGYIERYDYDALDRLTSIWYHTGGSITATEDTIQGYSYNRLCEYVYDSEGNLVEYIDYVTSVHERYRYQADGKLASTGRYKLNSGTMVLSDVAVYTYDAYHNPSGSQYATLLNGRQYTRTTAVSYDSLNRVTGFSDSGVTSGYTYHLLGMTASASLSRGNTLIQYAYTYGTTPNSLYDDLPMQTGRLESVTSTLKQGSTTRESNTFAYTYDDHDNITEIRIDGILKYSYEYDHLDQLIRENNVVAGKTYLYTYDNAGNITSKLTFDYTTDDTSELTEDIAESVYTYTYEDANWGDRLSSYRGVSFTYDSLGNPTSYYNGTSYTMGWSKGRQLSVITKGSSNFGFTYDAEGRRTSKLSFSGRVIQYVWDGDLLIGEYVVGQETITYTYDASGSPVGFTYTDLTGYYEGGVPCTFLYRKNPQGDIIGIVDSSGNEFVKYNYDAWGNLISYTMHGDGLYSLHYNMAEGNSFRYRGYYYDRETGFYYLNSRYYDPAIARFLNADESISTGTGLLGYNMYAYCNNNFAMYKQRSVSSKSETVVSSIPYYRNLNYYTKSSSGNAIPTNNQFTRPTPKWDMSFFWNVYSDSFSNSFGSLDISFIYVHGSIGASSDKDGSLTFASAGIGLLSVNMTTQKFFNFSQDSVLNPNLYANANLLSANGNIGLGISGKATLVSGEIGFELGDSVTVGVMGYVGVGFTFDFSNGISVGCGFGPGWELNIEFDWLELFY